MVAGCVSVLGHIILLVAGEHENEGDRGKRAEDETPSAGVAQSPEGQTPPCCLTSFFAVCVLCLSPIFAVHFMNWRFNNSGISLSEPYLVFSSHLSDPKNGIISCHATLPLTCLLLFPCAPLCLFDPLPLLFLASWILVSLQMVLETCTCKFDPVELSCAVCLRAV